jgi:N,N'-diacetyllegionaminate synthase
MAQPLRLIAEFCQNHNGDFDILRRMIDEAAQGGATHAKMQTIFADDLSFRPEFENGATDADGRIRVIKRPYQPEYQRLKSLELSYQQHRAFVEECRGAGIEPLTTAFTLTCIPHIRDLGWRAVKVASYDCGSPPLLEALAAEFDEIIVSTGASYDDEVEAAAALLRRSGRRFTMLHCVTIYPTPLAEMNLARIAWLRRLSPSVGLSDHSLVSRDGIKSALAAIHLGADTVERHFTVLPEDKTRDGKVSIRKEHLAEMRRFAGLGHDEQRAYLKRAVPEFAAMIGNERRPLGHDELLNRAYYRGRFCNKIDGRQVFNWEDAARRSFGHAAA